MSLRGLRLVEVVNRPKKSKQLGRRERLTRQLERQMMLVEATGRGERVKGEWWWRDEAGKFLIVARYGRHHLELAKGKHAVVCDDLPAVYTALDMIKIAVDRGDFDEPLEAASSRIRTNFRCDR